MLLPGLLPRPGPTPLCWGWDAQTLPADGMAVLAAAAGGGACGRFNLPCEKAGLLLGGFRGVF